MDGMDGQCVRVPSIPSMARGVVNRHGRVGGAGAGRGAVRQGKIAVPYAWVFKTEK